MNRQARELNRINNELDKQLNAQNNKVMEDIIGYLRGANISEYNQELIRQDLLEMFLSAQKRGENIQNVISEDYKVFCDNVIASLPPRKTKERVLEFIGTIFLCTSILGAINIIISKDTMALLRNLITGEPLNFQISVSVGALIAYPFVIAAALIIFHYVAKTSFSPEKKAKKVTCFSIAGVIAILTLIYWTGRATFFTVNIFVACAIVLMLYIAHRLIDEK